VLSPDTLIHNVDFGRTDVATSLLCNPRGHGRLPGHRDDSNLAEEARDYGKTIPRAGAPWGGRAAI